jgi:hypothetical protein
MDRLSTLPDELMLEIFSHLRPARLQGRAIDSGDIYGPGTSSKISLLTFHALCLTSKHLTDLATLELYGNMVLSSDRRLDRVECILNHVAMIASKPFLGRHLLYIQHHFHWFHGPTSFYAPYVQDNKRAV